MKLIPYKMILDNALHLIRYMNHCQGALCRFDNSMYVDKQDPIVQQTLSYFKANHLSHSYLAIKAFDGSVTINCLTSNNVEPVLIINTDNWIFAGQYAWNHRKHPLATNKVASIKNDFNLYNRYPFVNNLILQNVCVLTLLHLKTIY